MRLGLAAEEQPSSSRATEWAMQDAIRDQLNDLESALDDLDSNMDDFDDENWRDTVPTIRDTAADVRAAFEKIKEQVEG